jgi:FkbM family methyltransferase
VSVRRLFSNAAKGVLRLLGIESVKKQISGHQIRLPLDGHPFRAVLFDRAYWQHHEEAPYVEQVLTRIGRGEQLMDVGGFLGYYTLLMALAAGPKGRVIVFEPNPKSASIIKKMLGLNTQYLSSVTLFEQAVSDRNGAAEFVLSQSGSQFGTQQECETSVEVDVTTLDSTASKEHLRPSLIKIDVEGYELKVLQGAKEVLRNCRSVCLEVHPRKMEMATSHTVDDLFTFLSDQGFRPVYKFIPEKHNRDPGRPFNAIFDRAKLT